MIKKLIKRFLFPEIPPAEEFRKKYPKARRAWQSRFHRANKHRDKKRRLGYIKEINKHMLKLYNGPFGYITHNDLETEEDAKFLAKYYGIKGFTTEWETKKYSKYSKKHKVRIKWNS